MIRIPFTWNKNIVISVNFVMIYAPKNIEFRIRSFQDHKKVKFIKI